MNLFDIDDKYFSHPDYPYKNHIKNIADSFNDDYHKISAMFHDIGKLSKSFQNYIRNIINENKTTHTLESAFLFLKENKYNLDKETLPIFIAILKHHGSLENVNELADSLNFSEDILIGHPHIKEVINEIESISGLDGKFDLDECCDFFEEEPFVNHYNLSGIDEYFKIKEVFSKLIFSDKYEAIFKQAYKETSLINANEYIVKLNDLISSKNNNLSGIRNGARIDTLNKLSKNFDKNIFLIEAPTGIGKTFIALNLALEIAKNKKKKRIITALPMTSIIDQTYEEYSKIINNDILMKYHYLTYSKEYITSKQKKSDEFQEKINEIEFYKQKNLFISNSWSEDKIIITTFNQVLNIFYSNKNNDLVKFWTIRDSVIIFDEIQAIPRVLLKDFSETINFLAKNFNIDFILMSATIPDIKKFFNSSILCELLDNKYYSLDFNNRYSLVYKKDIDSEGKLIEEILKEYYNNKSVLTVLNTKKLALSIYEGIKNKVNDKNNIFLLSSLFIPKHRKTLIKFIKRKIKQGKKIILISTQVVEAGVDLDFDIGFREFSPLYSIIQTAGRINRENRPEIKTTAKLIIIPKMSKVSPYEQTDLLNDVVPDLLQAEIRENNLLPFLKKYFEIAIKRTSPNYLLFNKMGNLEFENVFIDFNANFMNKLPNIGQVFTEIKKDLYNSYHEKLQILFLKIKECKYLEEKMEIKAIINEIYKEISQYVINVPKDDIKYLQPFYNKENEMKICPFESLPDFYNSKTGWIVTEKLSEFF